MRPFDSEPADSAEKSRATDSADAVGEEPSWFWHAARCASIGLVLSTPVMLGGLLVAIHWARPSEARICLLVIIGCTTAILAAPWFLVTGLIAGLLFDHWALAGVIVLAPAWALNASFALRRWRFAVLMGIATTLAVLQCSALAALVAWPPTH